MADRMGVSAGHYANVESGSSGVGEAALRLCAANLGVNLAWLKTGKSSNFTNSGTGNTPNRPQKVLEKPLPYLSEGYLWEQRILEIIEDQRDTIDHSMRELRIPLSDILAGIGRRVQEEMEQEADHET